MFLSLLLLCFAACGSSLGYRAEWRAAKAPRPLGKVLVVALDTPTASREQLEHLLVEQLQARHIVSYKAQALENQEAQASGSLCAMARKHGFASFLTAHFVNLSRREAKSQNSHAQLPARTGHGYFPVFAPLHGDYPGYYAAIYHYTHGPNYYVPTRDYQLEIVLHDVQSERMVWGMVSNQVDTTRFLPATTELSQVVSKHLDALYPD